MEPVQSGTARQLTNELQEGETRSSEAIPENQFEKIFKKLSEPLSEDAGTRAILNSVLLKLFNKLGGHIPPDMIWERTLQGFRELKDSFCREGEMGILTYLGMKKIASRSVSFLVDDLIPTQSIGTLLGEWGIGKSPLAVQLLQSIASGISFLGRYAVHSPIPVLYFDGEGGIYPMSGVWETIAHFLGLPFPPPNAYIYGTNYSPTDRKFDSKFMQETIQRYEIKLTVIDPIRVFDSDAPEGNDKAMELINSFRSIAKKEECSFLFLHHPRKPRELQKFSLEEDPTGWFQQMSGAAALYQNVDFRIGLQKKEEDKLIMRHFVRTIGWSEILTLVREKDQETGDSIGYRSKSPLDDLEPHRKAEYRALPESFTTGNAKKAFNLSNNPTNERLKEWIDMKLIQKTGRGEYRKLWAERGN